MQYSGEFAIVLENSKADQCMGFYGNFCKLFSSEKEGLLERGGLNRGFKILLLLFFASQI